MKRALLFACLAACRQAPAPPPPADGGTRAITLGPEGMANAEVRTAKLEPQAFTPRLKAAAVVSGDPKSIARIGSRVPGRVARIAVALGDRVKKGQPLLELDAVETHEAALDYATARARARTATDALARQRQLVAERVGAEQELRRAEAEAAAAGATLHEAEEHLRFLGLSAGDLARTSDDGPRARSVVRAPIDGQIAALAVSIGQVLQGTEDIVTVAQIDKLWVDLRIYERDLGRVERGRRVEIRALAFPDRRLAGTLTFVGDLIDPVTRTVQARATLEAPGPLRPGMSATALIAMRAEPDTLWLPAEAIQKHSGEAVVFVRTGERRFEPRRVAIGPEEGGFVRIRGGLAAGTEVVVHGALALRGELERAALEE